MRILALGDIVGRQTIAFLRRRLWEIRSREKIDFVIANAENASDIKGLSAADAEELLDCGIDLLTLGNHAYGMRDIYDYLDGSTRVIRPANYPPDAPGCGYTVMNIDGWRLLCINVSGRVYLDPLASPFDTVERILEREKGSYDIAVMDIHAEATSEKLAIAHVFDGRIQVMFGTHTHVPTADARILPKGSAYLTDLGMCGPTDGILGTDRDAVIERFRKLMPVRFEVADGDIAASGAIFELDGTAVKSLCRIEF